MKMLKKENKGILNIEFKVVFAFGKETASFKGIGNIAFLKLVVGMWVFILFVTPDFIRYLYFCIYEIFLLKKVTVAAV